MLNATKKQMVDFVYHLYKAHNKRVSYRVLNSLDKNAFVRIIESDEQVANAFKQYLLNNQKQERAAKSVRGKNIITGQKVEIPSDPQEAENRFVQLIENLSSDSTNFMYIMKLRGFLQYLPYGTIPTNVISNQLEVLNETATPIAMLLFDYYVNQQKYEESLE